MINNGKKHIYQTMDMPSLVSWICL